MPVLPTSFVSLDLARFAMPCLALTRLPACLVRPGGPQVGAVRDKLPPALLQLFKASRSAVLFYKSTETKW